jgi:hypothetical protein
MHACMFYYNIIFKLLDMLGMVEEESSSISRAVVPCRLVTLRVRYAQERRMCLGKLCLRVEEHIVHSGLSEG